MSSATEATPPVTVGAIHRAVAGSGVRPRPAARLMGQAAVALVFWRMVTGLLERAAPH